VLTDGTPGGFTVEVQSLDGTRQAWDPIDDIYAAQPDQQVYMLDPAAGQLTFGSGLQGARVPLGATVIVSYSYGGGPQGQAAIGAVNKSVALSPGFSVTNPVATWGASNGEPVAHGEEVITRWLRHRDRLVTAQDFKDLTQRTPAIDLGRVEVLPLFNPDQCGTGQSWPGMVTLLVIPRSDPLHPDAPTPDRQFLNAVCSWLDPRRLVTTELHVRGPIYQPIWVSVGFEVLPGQVPSIVQQQVITAVKAFLSPLTGGLPASAPGGLPGDPNAPGPGWPLGVNVRSQDIEAIATRVPGVRYVDSVRIAATDANGIVVASVDPVPISGLQLPAATVFANVGAAVDPATIIGSSQPVPSTQVPVPVVPPTC
jgi:predicted phage baseplate assembly protein